MERAYPINYREAAALVGKKVNFGKVYGVSSDDMPWTEELKVYEKTDCEAVAIAAIIGNEEEMLDKIIELGIEDKEVTLIALFDTAGKESNIESVFVQGTMWYDVAKDKEFEF